MRLLSVFYLIAFCLIAIVTPGSAHAFKAVVLGDSISAAYGLNESDGWVHLAENELREEFPNVEFFNASISGDTTDGGLRRLPATLEQTKPDLLIIELGGNDGLRGYSPKKMQQNLEAMIRLGQAADAQILVLGMMIPSNYGVAYTRLFSQAFVKASEATDTALIPFFLEPIAASMSFFQSDGIHPTAEAQPLLVEHVLPMIVKLMEAQRSP